MQIYDSIESIPIWNHHQILETGNIKHLLSNHQNFLVGLVFKLPPFFIKKIARLIQAHKLWSNISDEVLEVQMKSEDFLNELNEEKYLLLLEIEYALDPGALNTTLYLAAKDEKAKKKDQKPFDLYGSISIMSSFFGYRVDPKNTTLSEYFANVNLMKKSKPNGKR